MAEWHILTAEYPPQRGGVSDYTRTVAEALAEAGDAVHVWSTPPSHAGSSDPSESSTTVHRALGALTPAALWRAGQGLNRYPSPRRLLVQWVPHAYRFRSLNIWFCLWLWGRARLRGDRVEIMVHEAFLSFGARGLLANLAASGHRLMTVILLHAATRVWVSTPAWISRWKHFTLGRSVPFGWTPIPSSIPVVDDLAGVKDLRARLAPGGAKIVGHFGTCRGEVAALLADILSALLAVEPAVTVVMIGRGGEEFCSNFIRNFPSFEDRIHATGGLPEREISVYLSACDLLVQPYPDGINSRQSSAMAGLAHGRAIVTTSGKNTEPVWDGSGGVSLAAVGDAPGAVTRIGELLSQPAVREEMGRAAWELYRSDFAIQRTVDALRTD